SPPPPLAVSHAGDQQCHRNYKKSHAHDDRPDPVGIDLVRVCPADRLFLAVGAAAVQAQIRKDRPLHTAHRNRDAGDLSTAAPAKSAVFRIFCSAFWTKHAAPPLCVDVWLQIELRPRRLKRSGNLFFHTLGFSPKHRSFRPPAYAAPAPRCPEPTQSAEPNPSQNAPFRHRPLSLLPKRRVSSARR